MATRSFDDLAGRASARWSADGKALAAALGTQLEAEVDAKLAIGRDIIAARTAHSLTQQQLAARAAVQQAEISKIERGLGNPTRDTLVRIAAALGAHVRLVPDSVQPAH